MDRPAITTTAKPNTTVTPQPPDIGKLKELFFMDKCRAGPDESLNFYKWCSSFEAYNRRFKASCIGIRKADLHCTHELSHVNGTRIIEKETCDVGKAQTATFTYPLTPDLRDKIEKHCHLWWLGQPFSWWVILLIVLAIISVFSIAAGLFWQYWLKKRWQRPKGSTLESRWTSSPVSSTSSTVPPVRVPSARSPYSGAGSGAATLAGSGALSAAAQKGRSSTSGSRKKTSLVAPKKGSTSLSRSRRNPSLQ